MLTLMAAGWNAFATNSVEKLCSPARGSIGLNADLSDHSRNGDRPLGKGLRTPQKVVSDRQLEFFCWRRPIFFMTKINASSCINLNHDIHDRVTTYNWKHRIEARSQPIH